MKHQNSEAHGRVSPNLDSAGGVIEEEDERKKEHRLEKEIEAGIKPGTNWKDYVAEAKVNQGDGRTELWKEGRRQRCAPIIHFQLPCEGVGFSFVKLCR